MRRAYKLKPHKSKPRIRSAEEHAAILRWINSEGWQEAIRRNCPLSLLRRLLGGNLRPPDAAEWASLSAAEPKQYERFERAMLNSWTGMARDSRTADKFEAANAEQ